MGYIFSGVFLFICDILIVLLLVLWVLLWEVPDKNTTQMTINSVWIPRWVWLDTCSDRFEINPFDPYKSSVKVLDIKDGWVRYTDGKRTQDKKITKFVWEYQPLPEEYTP